MWKSVKFTPPPAVQEIAAGLMSGVNNLGGALSQGAAGLGGLGLPSLPAPPDLSATLRGAATDALQSPVSRLTLTPYQYGVGERKGEYAYLTPDAAIKTMLARLGDIAPTIGSNDSVICNGETTPAMAMLLIAAPGEAEFARSLSAFNAVYPIKDLQRAERRASALASLETDKFEIPPEPGAPAWGKAAPLNDPVGRDMALAAGEQLAIAEGLEAAAKAPQAVMAEFSAKAQARALAAKDKLAALSAGFAGENPGWHGLYLEGGAADMARALAGLAPPLPETYKCCALAVWVGPPQKVRYFKEAFGL